MVCDSLVRIVSVVASDFDVNSIFVMLNIAKLGFVVVGANFSVLKDINTVSKGGSGGRKKALESVKFRERNFIIL
jgi:hypothetical protein